MIATARQNVIGIMKGRDINLPPEYWELYEFITSYLYLGTICPNKSRFEIYLQQYELHAIIIVLCSLFSHTQVGCKKVFGNGDDLVGIIEKKRCGNWYPISDLIKILVAYVILIEQPKLEYEKLLREIERRLSEEKETVYTDCVELIAKHKETIRERLFCHHLMSRHPLHNLAQVEG